MSAVTHAQQLAAAAAGAAKRIRHRAWLWCRHHNGYCDNPVWRVVADRLHMPPYQVIAFALRLEELANISSPRGYVGDFNPTVFGSALGMSAEDAARIYAELEHSDVGWIDQEHLATFWARNKDDEPDTTAALRSRRTYARKQLRKGFARLAREGLLPGSDRDLLDALLEHMADDELFELDLARKNGGLLQAGLSTSHGFSRRENVRPHARADQRFEDRAVDNSGGGASRASGGSAKAEASGAGASPQPDIETWLATEGVRIVVVRMNLPRGLAETKLMRWQREVGGDAAAIAGMIEAADHADKSGPAFLVSITDQIKQRLQDGEGPRLPLMRKIGGAA